MSSSPADPYLILTALADTMANFDDQGVVIVTGLGHTWLEYDASNGGSAPFGQANTVTRGEAERAVRAQGLIRLDYRGPEEMSPMHFCPIVTNVTAAVAPSDEPAAWYNVMIKTRIPSAKEYIARQLLILTTFQFESWVWRLRSWALSRMRLDMYRRCEHSADGEGTVGIPEDKVPVALTDTHTPGFNIRWARLAAAPSTVHTQHAARRLNPAEMASLLDRLVIGTEDQVVKEPDPFDSGCVKACLNDALAAPRLGGFGPVTDGRLVVESGPQLERLAGFIATCMQDVSKGPATVSSTLGRKPMGMSDWVEAAVWLLVARVDRIDDISRLDVMDDTGMWSVRSEDFAVLSLEYHAVIEDALAMLHTLTRTPIRGALSGIEASPIYWGIRMLRKLACRAIVNCWTATVSRGNESWDENISPLSIACTVPLCPCGALRRVGLYIDPDGAADGTHDIPAGITAQCRHAVVLSHHLRQHTLCDEDSPPPDMTKARLNALITALRKIQEDLAKPDEVSRGTVDVGKPKAKDPLRRIIDRDVATLERAAGMGHTYEPSHIHGFMSGNGCYQPDNVWCLLWCDLPLMVGMYVLRRGEGKAIYPKELDDHGFVKVDENGHRVSSSDDKKVVHRFVGFNMASLSRQTAKG